MHMADALLSPQVGASMWVATAGTIAFCSSRVKRELDDRKIPLMGVLGAFIFAAQMINFTIPGTGSSGHLGGGMILAILLGPWAAFLVMASVLMVQALFFADGGLLALGCNIFNLGVFPCFIAYPLVFRPLVGSRPGWRRLLTGSLVSAVVGLQLGAFGVVLQTLASGVSELPFRSFLLLMQPIHLAIGLVEGLVTAMVVSFVWKARPEILQAAATGGSLAEVPLHRLLVTLALFAAFVGGGLSWFASENPDGLEWAMEHVSGQETLATPVNGLHATMAELQEKTTLLPDYGFKSAAEPASDDPAPRWSQADTGATVSGLVGGGMTLLVAAGLGWLLKRRRTTLG